MPDSSTDPLQEKVEATDIDEAGCRIGECCMQEDVVGLVLTEHVVDKVGRHGHLAAGLLQPGVTTFDHPEIMAQTRNERFIRLDSASHASRSSPSMSARNNRASASPPSLTISPTSFRPEIARAYSLATKPSGPAPARSRRRVSSMPRL